MSLLICEILPEGIDIHYRAGCQRRTAASTKGRGIESQSVPSFNFIPKGESRQTGQAQHPVATDLIAGFEELEPALRGIASGIQPAIVSFFNMAISVHGMVPDFLQIFLSTSSFWINLGGTLGLIGNAFTTIVDSIQASQGKKLVLVCGDTRLTYAQFAEKVEALAHSWLQQGLRPGDRIALHWKNGIELATCYYACFAAGLVAVPVNNRLTPEARSRAPAESVVITPVLAILRDIGW